MRHFAISRAMTGPAPADSTFVTESMSFIFVSTWRERARATT
jgi:hypothetical protein